MGSVFLRGNTWVAEYTDRHGRRRRKSLGRKGVLTKTMARRILQRIEQKIELGRWDMVEPSVPTLREFSEEYLEYQRNVRQKRSWRKDEAHLRRWNNVFGERKLSDITAKDIDDYKLKRSAEVKAATVNRELEVLRHLFYLAARWKKCLGTNPVSEAGLIPVHSYKERILTVEEEEALLASSAPHLKPIIITALNTGMRKGEILSLRWDDVDLENNVITVRQENSKSKKTRKVPVNSTLRRVLLRQRLKTGGSEYVFLNPEGKPYLRHDSLKRSFEGACSRAGIKGLRFHDLRHTAATRMVEAGANIVAVSKILGHADLKTTMRYAHPDHSLKEAVEALSTYFPPSATDKSTDNELGRQ